MKGLGKRIKTLRKTRKLTLVEVAKSTGIDQATLSRIENGVMTGTVNSHMKIAEVLGLSLPDLYKDVLAKESETKDKAAREKLETFSNSTGAVAELLTTGILQKKMMPVILKIRPGGRTAMEEFTAGSERFIYVLKGTLELAAEKKTQAFKTGESLYFNGALPHHFRNPGKSESHILSILTPTSL